MVTAKIQPKQPSSWEIAADDVLSMMLTDSKLRDAALYELKIMPAFMPTPKHRATFEAIAYLHARGETVSDVTVLNRASLAASLDDISYWISASDAIVSAQFYSSAKVVKEHGLKHGAIQLLQKAQQELQGGVPFEVTRDKLMTVLAGLNTASSVTRETARENAEDFEAFLNSTPPPTILTGIPWYDEIVGGLSYGDIHWIVAPYKSRKTTVALNLILGVLMEWVTRGCAGDPPSIAIASGEMTRRMLSGNFVAMLAHAYLKANGWHELNYKMGDTELQVANISGQQLNKAGVNYLKWHPKKVEAVNFGLRVYKQFGKSLRLYDRSQEGGSLTDIRSVIHMLKRDQATYGCNIAAIDYLQLFKGPESTLFEYVSSASLELQRFARGEGITLFVVAQQNEAAINSSGSSYSAGVKGGGDPTATADYLLATQYKNGDLTSPEDIKLTMKFNRHGSGGSDTYEVMDIHPPSGLLRGAKWIEKLAEAKL